MKTAERKTGRTPSELMVDIAIAVGFTSLGAVGSLRILDATDSLAWSYVFIGIITGLWLSVLAYAKRRRRDRRGNI